MFIGSLLIFTATTACLVNAKKVKESGGSSLENLLLELISAYEERIHNVSVTRSRPSRVIRRRNISLPSEEGRTVKYSFSIRGSLDNLKSPVVHLFKSKKKWTESNNRSECARYKLLMKRTNEEFLAYLDKLIEEKTTLLRETEAKIVETKRKIGKARLSYDSKIIHNPTANEETAELAKKEYLMRCRLMEKLNDYLAAATNLIVPVGNYPVGFLPRINQASQPRLYRRSAGDISPVSEIPFLGGRELTEINRLIRGTSYGGSRSPWVRRRKFGKRKRIHPRARDGVT